MPFYEYQCRGCGEQTEVLQKVSDPPLKKCPQCGRNQLEKLMSAPVFRLKGAGWYETDFKSDAEKKRNLAGAEKDEPAKAADDKAVDKPADKPVEKKAETPKAEPVAAKARPAARKPPKPAAKPAAKTAAKPARRAAAGKSRR